MAGTATVTFFHHSGFTVAVGETLMVFDYWRGEGDALPRAAWLTDEDFKKYRQVLVFVSHDHEDHFDEVIYTWDFEHLPITYIVADDLPIGCDYEKDYPVDLEKGLFESIQRGDYPEAAVYADKFVAWMEDYDGQNLMAIRLKILEFSLWAEKLAYENGGMTYRFGSRDSYLPEIMSMESVPSLKKWFLEKVRTSCENIVSKREESSSDTIRTAKEYIQQNFAKEISLDEVSRVVNISPYYFSKLFKEAVGENFIDYLTGIRIEKAKELLTGSALSMKEICAACGYQDPNYFSRNFKKKVGLTPTEYKEKYA